MKLNFVKMGINGEGIGYENRRPVFCDGVLPGETAIIDIEEDHGIKHDIYHTLGHTAE